jgi:hypothetical protein
VRNVAYVAKKISDGGEPTNVPSGGNSGSGNGNIGDSGNLEP